MEYSMIVRKKKETQRQLAVQAAAYAFGTVLILIAFAHDAITGGFLPLDAWNALH